MMRRWSLRARFVAAASVCLLPLLAVILFVLNESLNNSRDQILDNEIAISNVVAQTLSQTLDDHRSLLNALAENPQVTNATNDAGTQAVFSDAMTYRASLKGLFIVGPDGNATTFLGIDPNPLLGNTNLKALTDSALNAGSFSVSNTISVPNTDVKVVTLIAPILPQTDDTSASVSVEGKPVGAVGAFIDVDRLRRAFAPAAEFGSDLTITIVGDGTIIADQSGAEAQTADLTTRLTEPITEALNGKRARAEFEDGTNRDRLAVVTPIVFEGARWAVLVT